MNPPLRILGLLSGAIALLCCGSNAYAVGATTPFKTYEAEGATLAGGASSVTYVPVDTNQSSPPLEASGHAYVQLTGTGQSVTWTNTTGQNITAINVRFSIPDAPNGGGTTATLDLYVNGTMRQAVTLDSALEYLYVTDMNQFWGSDTPGPGLHPHMFWDDAHFFVTGAPIAPGSTIMFKQDAANTAAFYYIDCLDVENPPAPLIQPANSLSITSYGAVVNDPNVDNKAAIQHCFNDCQAQGKIAWIPSGTFYMTNGLSATGITIEGAGMWYSVLYATVSAGNGIIEPNSCTLRNIRFDGRSQGTGINIKGANWLVDSVWLQHLGPNIWCDGISGTVQNCRINSGFSDGININSGNGQAGLNMTINNNFVRGSGDDGIAGGTIGATVTNNTSVGARWASCMGIYAAQDVLVANNLLTDTASLYGLNVTNFGGGGLFQSGLVVGNTILRGGVIGGGHAAVNFGFDSLDGMQNVVFANNIINNSVNTALAVFGGWENAIVNNSIDAPRFNGIEVRPGNTGNAVFINNTITNVPSGYSATINNSPSTFRWINGTLASSYNSANSVGTEPSVEGGRDVGYISNGSYTAYNNVNLNGMTFFQARVAGWNSGSTITIHLDSPTGTVIGTCPVPSTGGYQNWTTVNCNLNGSASGIHNVYLVYASAMNIQWFDFQPNAGGVPRVIPQNGELINLVCQTSGMALDNGNSLSDGNPAIQWPLGTGNLNQQWKVVNIGGGYFNLICQASGKALDNGGSTTVGAGVKQWTQQANNPNQEWMFVWLDTNKYNLACRTSGLLLDNGGSTSAGAPVVQEFLTQAASSGAISQQVWRAVPIPQSGAIYHLVSKTNGKAMENGGSTVSGSSVIQWDNMGGNINQEWQLVDVGGGYFNLICQKSGMALDNNHSTSSGTGLSQFSQQGGTPNQKWQPVYVGNGYFNLICQTSGMALDNAGSTTNGTQLQQATLQSGNSNQQWSLELVAIPQAKIAAASYNSASSGIQTQGCSEGGQNVDFITNGSYTVYNNVNMSGLTGFRARVASANAGGNIEVHMDSPTGTLVGTTTVPGTGGWQSWTTVSCSLTPSAGTHNLYLIYTGGGGYLFNLEWFELWQQLLH